MICVIHVTQIPPSGSRDLKRAKTYSPDWNSVYLIASCPRLQVLLIPLCSGLAGLIFYLGLGLIRCCESSLPSTQPHFHLLAPRSSQLICPPSVSSSPTLFTQPPPSVTMADDAQVSLARFPPLCVSDGWSQSTCLHLGMEPISLSFLILGFHA